MCVCVCVCVRVCVCVCVCVYVHVDELPILDVIILGGCKTFPHNYCHMKMHYYGLRYRK